MNVFEKQKIALLKKKIEIHTTHAHKQGKFSLFDTSFANEFFSKDLTYEQLKSYYDIVTEWEQKCNLPYEVGISIDKIAKDNTVMVHRANLELSKDSDGLPYNESLFNIMNEGLKNYGHLNATGGGATSYIPPSLTLTMTPLKGLAGYINLIASYKSNDAIILAAFPKDLVNSEGEIVDNSRCGEVYDLSDFPPKVQQQFMVGAILKKSNGLDQFYTRDEIINSMDNTKTGHM